MSNRLRTRNFFTSAGASVDPDAAALFSAMSTPPTAQRRVQINTAISALKAAGVWALLDTLQVYAAADSQAAVLNWRKPGTYNASFVNSPTFVADRYVQGDGAASFVSSGFNPATAASPNFQQNAAHFAVWKVDTGTPAGSLAGYFTSGVGGTTIGTPAGGASARINQTATLALPIAVGAAGFIAINRSGATAIGGYLNGAQVATGNNTSIAVPNGELEAGRFGGTSYNSTRFAALSTGGGLTASQHAALYAALLTYMQGVGAL